MPTTYSPEKGLQVWRQFLAGRVSQKVVFAELEVYVSSWALKWARVRGIAGSLQGEEAIQEARLALLKAIKAKRIPSENRMRMHAYLKAIVCREVDSYPLSNRQVDIPPEAILPLARRSNPPLDEALTMEQLPAALRRRAGALIKRRFPEVSPAATKYILDRLLNGEPVSQAWLRRQYLVESPRFFVEAVLIAVRTALYQMRSDVYPLSKSLAGTAYDSFLEANDLRP